MASERAELAGFARRAFSSGLFAPERPVSLARAPGRLDVMGGIADYSGSLVLELPLREAARAAAQRREDDWLWVSSAGSSAPARSLRMPLAELVRGSASSYEGARAYFRRNPADHWAAYVAGSLVVLRLGHAVTLPRGLALLVDSDVPEGKGVSSSAAVEVAAMLAVATELDVELAPVELALACQRVENLVAGAPCGVMDQMTSALGREGQLLELLCRPAEVQGFVELPADLAFFGVDSGLRHAVTGASYGDVRVGAFMGRRILAEREGPIEYLSSVPRSLAERYDLPDRLLGGEFLARFGETGDPVTAVEPERSYPVRAATLHPIDEHARVTRFRALLREPAPDRLSRLGELMYQSHDSYSACGLGSTGTDRLVSLVRSAPPSAGLFGAKITGGGSGGTVAILGRPDALRSVSELSRRYSEETGLAARVFHGSSAGAIGVGGYRASDSGELTLLRHGSW